MFISGPKFKIKKKKFTQNIYKDQNLKSRLKTKTTKKIKSYQYLKKYFFK